MSWLPKKCVVVPFDFSDFSFAAVEYARDHFVNDPAALHVMHVLPTLHPSEPGVLWSQVDDKTRKAHVADAIRARLADPKFQGAQIIVAVGAAGDEVARHAEEQHADLIVVPSHGHSGLKRILLGSVADRIVRLAHCPVLILRK